MDAIESVGSTRQAEAEQKSVSRYQEKPSAFKWMLDALDSVENTFNPEISYSRETEINPNALKEAIVGQESGGDYNAISTHTDSRGNHSYGKYQILGTNIPQWTMEALGQKMNIRQFLRSQEAQDKVFAWHIGNLIKKYGNINDIASVYFSGGAYAKNKDKKDASGKTVAEYASDINRRYAAAVASAIE
jgi:hypothetical protein